MKLNIKSFLIFIILFIIISAHAEDYKLPPKGTTVYYDSNDRFIKFSKKSTQLPDDCYTKVYKHMDVWVEGITIKGGFFMCWGDYYPELNIIYTNAWKCFEKIERLKPKTMKIHSYVGNWSNIDVDRTPLRCPKKEKK